MAKGISLLDRFVFEPPNSFVFLRLFTSKIEAKQVGKTRCHYHYFKDDCREWRGPVVRTVMSVASTSPL